MRSLVVTRHAALSLAACLTVLYVVACGGGGGGGGGGAGPPPADTPLPTQTPTPTIGIVHAGESIAQAARRAPAGSTIIVSPGSYGPVVLEVGDVQDSVTLFADVTGELSESAAAPVTIEAGARPAAISLSGQQNLTVDGFTVRGGSTAGVLVTDGFGIVIRSCTAKRNSGDGVRVERTSGGLVFNSVLTTNDGAGVRVLGSSGLQVINNTFYKNGDSGLAVGSGADPSDGLEVQNNIFEANTEPGIVVGPSTTSYQGDFNLNNDGYQGTEPGLSDIVGRNPLLVFPDGDDFHLQATEGGTTSPAVDAGNPATDAEFLDVLTQRSTSVDGALDAPPVDLGYHYPAVAATPTAVPRATKTNTPRATGTPGTPGSGATPTRTRTGAVVGATPTPTSPGTRPTRTPKPTRTPR